MCNEGLPTPRLLVIAKVIIGEVKVSENIRLPTAPHYDYFKFRKIDKRLIESIINSRLWFSTPSQLNDPLDCRIDLRRAWGRAGLVRPDDPRSAQTHHFFENKVLLDGLVAKLEDVGVCSFSLHLENTLMWSSLWR